MSTTADTKIETTGPQPCGTYGGFQRHKKSGEHPCEPCQLARNAYMKAYRAKNPAAMTAQVRQAKFRDQARAILSHRHHREYLDILTKIKAGDEDTLAELNRVRS